MGGTGMEYKSTFNLASAAGSLVTTYDTLNPPRGIPKAANQNGRRFRGVVSPRRKLSVVNVTFSQAASQVITVSIVDRDGTARVISTTTTSSATAYAYEPTHEYWIGPKENFRVDVANSGTPSTTGTITIFTNEA